MMASSWKEDQLRNIVENVTKRTFAGFENATKDTFGEFANKVFENVTKDTFENLTSDIIGDTYTTDGANATKIGLVEVGNRTLVDIENITHMEAMDAPAPEFM